MNEVSIFRTDNVTWEKKIVYNKIETIEIQSNKSKKYTWSSNSDNSEMSDYFIFLNKKFNDLEVWDLIIFKNFFNKKVVCEIQTFDLIDFESIEPFIEIFAKMK